MNDTILIDKLVDFQTDVGGDLLIKHVQEIPQSHLDALQIAKAETIGTPMGDFHRVCSIPTNLYEEWLRDGYDATKEPVRETLRRLRKYEFDKFITTTKQI